MKYGIVVNPRSLNYGDDIQSLATYNLVKKLGYNVDVFMDREKLNNTDTDEEIKLINSGWYMDSPENWPLAGNINPLFISMHISHNNNAIKLLIDKKYFDYYKKFEPIGCRDYHTVSLFKSIGIEAYFSGCLTLTLKNKFKIQKRTDEIIFVDAFNKNLPQRLRDKMYKKLVPDSIKNNIVKFEHSHTTNEKDINKRLANAERILEMYAKAHLVVTSRIHVALPCIAVGTPVLFTDVGFNLKNSRNRFDGIIQYFNKLDNSSFPFTGVDPISIIFRKFHFYNYIYNKSAIKFDWENPPANPVDISPIVNELENTVSVFLNS